MLNQIQGALMDEAKRMDILVSDIHARTRALAYAFQGTLTGVKWAEASDSVSSLEEAITEAGYDASTIHGIVDARACTRLVLRLRAQLDGLEEILIRGEEDLQREETGLLQDLYPAY